MEQIKCPICDSDSSNHFLSLKDRLEVSNEIFSLVECDCNFIYLNPRPNEKEIYTYYKNENYDPHNNVNFLYKSIQKFSFIWKVSIIKKISQKNNISILDYGAGKGEFASFFKKKNNNCHIDIYEPILNNFNLNNDIQVFSNHSDIKLKYNIITFWHSLEHIHNLNEVFSLIQKHLISDGYLFIAVPNLDAVEKKYFNKNWAPYDAPRHLYHFNYKSMKKILNKHNFKIINYKTLYQDSIYNIFLSLKTMSFSNTIKLFYYSIISILKILFINKKISSSILYICKRK